jgi:hypothetical protein
LTGKNFLYFIVITLLFFSCKTKPIENDNFSQKDCQCDSAIIIHNSSNIEGYSNKTSYFPNDTVKLFINSKSNVFNIELVEQKLNSNTLLKETSTNGIIQNYNQCSYKNGCNWQMTNKIIIPKNIKSGYLTINLSNKFGTYNIPIRIKTQVKNDILCIASTTPWHAYNNWGGASFYTYKSNDSCKSKTNASHLSLQRPFHKVIGSLNYQGHL